MTKIPQINFVSVFIFSQEKYMISKKICFKQLRANIRSRPAAFRGVQTTHLAAGIHRRAATAGCVIINEKMRANVIDTRVLREPLQ